MEVDGTAVVLNRTPHHRQPQAATGDPVPGRRAVEGLEDRGQGAAPGGGQINQIIWDPITHRALMTSYTTSTVTAYDPSNEASWPDNPTVRNDMLDYAF